LTIIFEAAAGAIIKIIRFARISMSAFCYCFTDKEIALTSSKTIKIFVQFFP